MRGIPRVLNGNGGPVSVGLVLGLLAAGLPLGGFILAEGRWSGDLTARVKSVEEWQLDYNRSVRPLRDQFIQFTGELPGLRREMEKLRMEIEALNERLNRLEREKGVP